MLLMNARDHVVVVVAAVAQGLGAERGLDVGQRDPGAGAAGPLLGQRDGHLEAGQHLAAVAAGAVDQVVERVVVGGRALGRQAPRAAASATASGPSGSRRNSVERLTAAAG